MALAAPACRKRAKTANACADCSCVADACGLSSSTLRTSSDAPLTTSASSERRSCARCGRTFADESLRQGAHRNTKLDRAALCEERDSASSLET
eukprot:1667573-Pleurochrysis_carterae.AAC.4